MSDLQQILQNGGNAKKVVEELVNKRNVSEDVAKAAVQCTPSKDLDECFAWVLVHHSYEELVSQLSRNFDDQYGKFILLRTA